MNTNLDLSTVERPMTNDREAWRIYWKVQKQLWRIEPEVSQERQEFLSKRRSITPDVEQGIYPFQGVKLSRADIEWLLATHEGGRGPVDWSDESQKTRRGLDLRGADVRDVDLSNLPLACTLAGSLWITSPLDWLGKTPEKQNIARAHFEGANFSGAHLEGANFVRAYLRNAYIVNVHMEGALFNGARLEGAYLIDVHCEDANLTWIHLERSVLSGVYFDRAVLRGAFFDSATSFENVSLGQGKDGGASFSDVRWGDVDLSYIDWTLVRVLGEEAEAERWKRIYRKHKSRSKSYKKDLIEKYQLAVRANRQLANVLQLQGFSEDAARFAYRGQRLQRKVWWYQGIRYFSQYLLSLLLDLVSGYGYKVWRSFFAYIIIILGFMGLYLLNAHYVIPHLTWDEALVLSMSSFHGRGFFTSGISLGDTYARISVLEAFLGLFVEVILIATFTRRIFGK